MKPAEPSLRDRHILVVGKNSYVGQFLSEYFAAQGAHLSAVGSAECDFLDSAKVEKLMQSLGGEPLTILFLAVVNKSADNSYDAFQKNVQMVWNLSSFARHAQIESVVYFSSVDVYGRSPKLPISEATPIDPDTWYGLAKVTSEWIVREELGSTFPTCILRLPGIFGQARNDRSVIGKLISSIRREGKVYLDGDGQVLRDYVFAPDLSRVVGRLVARKISGTYNLVSGTSVSLLDLIELIRETLQVDFETAFRPPNRERNFDMRYETAKLSAALGEFDFSPLSAGIRSYL